MSEKSVTVSEEDMARSPSNKEDAWPAALVALFRDERTAFVRLAYLLTGNAGVAEEIVQDAYLALHQSWDRVRHPRGYLRMTVVNGCRSWGRHQAVVRAHPLDRPEPELIEADELWDALGRLDERRRAAIVLRFYADLPFAEIAGILNCRLVTARTTVHRGLQQLKQEIDR